MYELRDEVNKYVSFMFNNYRSKKIRAPKVIHDTILGSNIFYPHEIAVIDTPIIQRLRRINQVDVVPFVFPSGNHNRFEHTLGVTVIVEKLVEALFRRLDEKNIDLISKEINKEYVMLHARMAAILHDCGHGPFSHMSEQIYEHFEDIQKERKSNPKLKGASPHEILSYLIVTSDKFKEYFEENISKVYDIKVDLDFVGDIIVGYVDDPEKAFIVEMVNGAFDADKLDYIQRDSHFTGIKMVLDIHRLFHTIDIIIDSKGYKRLSVDLSGVSTLEQIVFNKMMLLSTVYHHHKVRAAECLFKSIFEHSIGSDKNPFCLKFNSSADFLYLTDDDIYHCAKIENYPDIQKLANNLTKRDLPKRALVISSKTIKSGIENIQEFTSQCQDEEFKKLLRRAISEKTDNNGYKVSTDYIWIDVPKEPYFKEAIQWPIKNDGEEKGYIILHQIFPVDDWVRAFSENKYKAYIYTIDEFREIVHEASKKVLSEVFGIQFNKFARYLCKIENEMS